MPEHIKELSLGDILTIPIEFEVRELSTTVGYRKFDNVKLINDDLDLELYLQDTAYEQLVQEVMNIEKEFINKND